MKTVFSSILFVLLVMAIPSFASPVIGTPETWDAGLGTSGDWKVQNISGESATLQNPGGALQLTLDDSGSGQARVYADSLVPSSSGNFTGQYNSYVAGLTGDQYLVAQFSFRNVTDTPVGGLTLYFIGGGNLYTIALTQPAVSGSFASYSVSIGNESYWQNWGGGTFSTDFNNVTQFGLEVTANVVGGSHIYQLDNFELQVLVPEPETVWMILIVLASLGLTFRGRLSEIAGMIKARIRA